MRTAMSFWVGLTHHCGPEKGRLCEPFLTLGTLWLVTSAVFFDSTPYTPEAFNTAYFHFADELRHEQRNYIDIRYFFLLTHEKCNFI